MVEIFCRCGFSVRFPAPTAGEVVVCQMCQAQTRLASGEPIDPAAAIGDFDSRLVIEAGPTGVGDTFAVGGIPDIDLGKSTDRQIPLMGTSVSRAHAKLVRIDFGPSRWKVVDTASRNGVFLNGQPISEGELSDGDLIQIGEFSLRYKMGVPLPPVDPTVPGIVCPGCKVKYKLSTKICTTCGLDLKTGRPLVTAKGIDEDQLAEHADSIIRVISWLLWFGLFPIASEAFATYKPRATWVISGITFFVSLIFLIGTWGSNGEWPESMKNLMLWTGNHPTVVADIPGLKDLPESDQQEVKALLAQKQSSEGEFHFYQLLTNALLHAGIMHFVGNMIFMLVFGLRVNELIGDLKMAIIYPILAIMASGIYAIAEMNGVNHPALGASGAIMGLAGMYFVFFPLHNVHMAFWIRGGFLFGWRLYYKLFRMKGFWLLGLWIGFNDVLPTVLSSINPMAGAGDHTAHWAHLGGFASGVLIAVGLLCVRQVNAHGADILSVVMGPKAWALIGKPSSRVKTDVLGT